MLSVRIRTCHEQMYMTTFANSGEYSVPSVREIKNGDRQANKKSDNTSVSSTLTSSFSAWALSLRYGNEAEILKFHLVPNLP